MQASSCNRLNSLHIYQLFTCINTYKYVYYTYLYVFVGTILYISFIYMQLLVIHKLLSDYAFACNWECRKLCQVVTLFSRFSKTKYKINEDISFQLIPKFPFNVHSGLDIYTHTLIDFMYWQLFADRLILIGHFGKQMHVSPFRISFALYGHCMV